MLHIVYTKKQRQKNYILPEIHQKMQNYGAGHKNRTINYLQFFNKLIAKWSSTDFYKDRMKIYLPFRPSFFWEFDGVELSSLAQQSWHCSGVVFEHQWSGTFKKCARINFLNLHLYSIGDMTVGWTFFGTREDFTQVSSCLSHVYCLRKSIIPHTSSRFWVSTPTSNE